MRSSLWPLAVVIAIFLPLFFLFYLEAKGLTPRTLLRGWLDGEVSLLGTVIGFVGMLVFVVLVLLAIGWMERSSGAPSQ